MKKKGFTLLELIITLAITVVVLGVIYLFTLTNNKILTSAEINSSLQEEAEEIQRELFYYGTQSKGLIEVNGKVINNSNDFNYETMLSEEGKLKLEEIKLRVEDYYYVFICEDRELIFKKYDLKNKEVKDGEFSKSLSKNIEKIELRPIDFRMNKEGNFNKTPGIEISMILKEKIGNVEESLPLSIIIKFRNK